MNITIDTLAERRLWAFIRATNDEVGGMGYAFLEEDGSVHWRETFLVPQEVSASEVDFEKTNGDQVAVERALADGVLDEPNFVWVSWHSHHTLGAFWSGTDDKRIAAMNAVGVKRLLSFVGCHDGSYEMRVDVFGVKAHDIDIGQVTMSKLALIREGQADEFEQLITAEIHANVKTKKFEWPSSYGLTDTLVAHSLTDRKQPRSSRQVEEQDRRRVVNDLVHDEGYTHIEAESMVDALGIDDCELLLDGGFVSGNHNGKVART